MRVFARAAGVFGVIVCCWAAQAPLVSDNESQEFDLSRSPSVNATGHLIFATASSFLQHWPNTRYRNGHNLVPGTVAPGTLLYHGRGDDNLPAEPEWTATDPEHSLMFCRTLDHGFASNDTKEGGCWHLTLVVTRPLNVLYFDGSSAAKMDGGPMDSQDIVSWGKVIHKQVFSESLRIKDLCTWGQKFGVDGFVRMEMDFEIMLCDFTAGVEVASFLNLRRRESHRGPINVPNGPPGRSPGGHPPPLPPPPPGRNPGEKYPPPMDSQFHPSPMRVGTDQAIVSGAWHNNFPGDTRIQLDYSRLVSFYDTSLAPSLVAQRFDKPRLDHRIDGISADDTSVVMKTLENVLQEPSRSSVVDWRSIMQVVVDRYADRLETIQYFINETAVSGVSEPSAKRLHAVLSMMVQPYQLYTLNATRGDAHAWATKVFQLCSTTHSAYLHKIPSLTPSELLLLSSIEETTMEICRVTTKMWAQGVEAGLDEQIQLEPATGEPDFKDLIREWDVAVNSLMHWLDWGVWVKCRPACDYDSVCYLPTWPFFAGGPRGRPGPGGPDHVAADSKYDYEDPQPRCVSRFIALEEGNELQD